MVDDAKSEWMKEVKAELKKEVISELKKEFKSELAELEELIQKIEGNQNKHVQEEKTSDELNTHEEKTPTESVIETEDPDYSSHQNKAEDIRKEDSEKEQYLKHK